MCRRVTCKTCGKASYAGCGMHVDQVLAGVPAAERCAGHEGDKPIGRASRWFRRP